MNRRSKGEHFYLSTSLNNPLSISVLQVLVLLVVISEPLESKHDFPLDNDGGDEAAIVSSHVSETPLQAR